MKRVIFLNSNTFPEKFGEMLNLNITGTELYEFMENSIIQKINEYNSKMNISNVEYFDFNKDEFFALLASKYNGIIVDKISISDFQENDTEVYSYKNENGDNYFKIRGYIFLTSPKGGGRNIVFSQIIFPALLIYMNYYLDTPMYTILNHPAYCINLFNKKFTQQSILNQIYGLNPLGIKYLDIFSDIEESEKFHLNSLLKYINATKKKDELFQDFYENDFFKINFKDKRMKLKDPKPALMKMKDDKEEIHGSSEKFYLMNVLPPSILAIKENYHLNYEELSDFYNEYYNTGKLVTDKMARFNYLIKYFKKLQR